MWPWLTCAHVACDQLADLPPGLCTRHFHELDVLADILKFELDGLEQPA